MQAAPAPPGQLRIEHASAQAAEDGEHTPAGFHFRPGETVFFRFQISGYQRKEDGDESRVNLSWKITVSDPNETPVVEASSGKLDSRVTAEDKEWMPVGRRNIVVPGLAPSGEYKIALTLKDEFSGSEASSETRFLVAGHDVAPSETLVVRNLRFLRDEEDGHPLEVAAFRPGDTLWVRFDITGYKFGEGNRFSIEYRVRVLLADGSIAYEQPEATPGEDASFYPQRYLPGVFSLNFPPDLKTGEYTLIVGVRDKTGNQSAEATAKFSVE
jgi:hypothetical protein